MKLDRTSLALLLAGGLLTVALASSVPGEVFFSGDGGVKALLVKQFAAGTHSGPLLELPAEPAVSEAWAEGLYPFEPPFVYAAPSGRIVSFPLAFAALSAPLYRAFGNRGLYVLPVLGVWLTWLCFWRTLQRLSLPSRVRHGAVFALIFGTNLTLFAGAFWEHALYVAAVAPALDLLVTRSSAVGPSRAEALFAGSLLGLSFLLRSEGLLFTAATCAYVIHRRRVYPRALTLAASASIATLGCFALNTMTYGHPLGMHREQVTEGGVGLARIKAIALIASELWARFGVFMPIGAVVVGVTLWLTWRRQWRALASLQTVGLLVVGTAFLVAVPLVLPNAGGKQLGPRYLLALSPLFVLVAAELLGRLDQLPLAPAGARKLQWALTGALVVGVGVNSIYEVFRLVTDNAGRIWPALQYAQHAAPRVVVMTSSVASQELAALFGQKQILLARDRRDFVRALAVASALREPSVLVASMWEPETAWLPEGMTAERHGAFGIVELRTVAVPSPSW